VDGWAIPADASARQRDAPARHPFSVSGDSKNAPGEEGGRSRAGSRSVPEEDHLQSPFYALAMPVSFISPAAVLVIIALLAVYTP
jgi:hypothetical protein